MAWGRWPPSCCLSLLSQAGRPPSASAAHAAMLDAAAFDSLQHTGWVPRVSVPGPGGENCIFNSSVSLVASFRLLAEAVTKANLDSGEEDTDSIILIGEWQGFRRDLGEETLMAGRGRAVCRILGV